MAFTCGFFNSVNHDRKYDAVQHGMIFDGIITDGIYATYLKAMVVKASSNPSEVIVQPGRAWFNHTWSYNDADYPIAAPEPEVVLDRIDTLVLDVNSEDAVRDCQFLWVQGTPTSQVPEPPELIHTATHNQYPLCDVYRQAGTTQIYAADITNRVGTSDCPFVTGVLEGINIDDLLAQWDDEFHTWENATKASFEGWMLNQQAVYSAWWDSLKTQMAGDVADVEEWVQTIKDIIDSETATHLQLEIDEINSMLPSGSHITVTTADTELYSRAVTITDEDGNTVTSQFDATGVAVFKSVPYVGNLTIESTDGTRTATAVVNTPYFARYEFPLAFWSATVNITGDTELGGETVTITDSSQILVGTVVLNASGIGVFNATYPDTYKFSVTHGGQTMEVSLAVTQETTYNVTIHAGFNWRGWVDTARDLDSSDYDSLDEVLADELAVRELCLEHACVDYLAAVSSVNSDIETIINNDLFAKWANNSDYSLDVLGANVAIKALMDAADKYGYGELALMPIVPIMTSNTTPSGVVSASSEYSAGYAAWKAFDGNSNSYWDSVADANLAWLTYEFPTSVCVRRMSITPHVGAYSGGFYNYCKSFRVVASKDGEVWEDILPVQTLENIQTATTFIYDLNNSEDYKYYRLRDIDTYLPLGEKGIEALQFYAYAPKGNVPAMTSNSAPYGTASASSAQSGADAYKVFDEDYSTYWNATGTTATITYKFTNPVCAKRARLYVSANNQTITIKASNDGSTYTTLESAFTLTAGTITDKDITNDNYYLYYQVEVTKLAGQTAWLHYLQFYGRELSVSVPTMTSNTSPFGEAKASTYFDNNYLPYKAFDRADITSNSSYSWMPSSSSDAFGSANVSYDFGKMVKLGMFSVGFVKGTTTATNFHYKIQGSTDGTTWEDITQDTALPSLNAWYNYSASGVYRYFRLLYLSNSANNLAAGRGWKLQFYGLDYSEKEFEEGTTKKWLYDHGLKLGEITYNDGSYGSHEETDNGIILRNSNASSGADFGTFAEDLTNFNLARAKVTQANNGSGIDMRVMDTSYGYIAGVAISSNMPNNIGLDIGAINSNILIGFCIQGNAYMEFNEMWLE